MNFKDMKGFGILSRSYSLNNNENSSIQMLHGNID